MEVSAAASAICGQARYFAAWPFMLFNLVVAVIWLGIALVLLVGPFFSPDLHRRLLPFHLNPGWVALGLAIYNVYRWWSYRLMQKMRRQNEEEARRLRSSHDGERDPTFDFGDPQKGSDPLNSGGLTPFPDEPSPNPKRDMNV